MSQTKNENRPLPEYPLVLVEWIDASRLFDGWIDMAEVPTTELHKCVTVGFVVREDWRGKILIPTIADVEHAENQHAYGGMLIPASAIQSVRKLR